MLALCVVSQKDAAENIFERRDRELTWHIHAVGHVWLWHRLAMVLLPNTARSVLNVLLSRLQPEVQPVDLE